MNKKKIRSMVSRKSQRTNRTTEKIEVSRNKFNSMGYGRMT